MRLLDSMLICVACGNGSFQYKIELSTTRRHSLSIYGWWIYNTYLKLCDNPKLRVLGYRRINFLSHRYFMLYRIENNIVYVDNIFHELQDYENKMN